MYTKLQDFYQTWQNESQGTQKLFEVLTDESLSQAITPEDRTLGRLAWHLITTIGEMAGHTELRFSCPTDQNQIPTSAKEIAQAYQQASQAFIEAIQTSWTDADLQEESDMYGEMWANGLTLEIIIQHQIHHRGQMTVLMRQAGLKVPGIYGPAREEWEQFGMAVPEI